MDGVICISEVTDISSHSLDSSLLRYLVFSCSVVSDSATPWTIACQAPLSMGFPRQEQWSGLTLPSPGDLPDPGIKLPSLRSTALVGKFFITSNTWEAQYIICVCTSESEAAQSCPTLCDPVDYSPPGSSIHGILQARMLEWVAEASSRGSSQSRDGTHVSMSTCLARWVLYH